MIMEGREGISVGQRGSVETFLSIPFPLDSIVPYQIQQRDFRYM